MLLGVEVRGRVLVHRLVAAAHEPLIGAAASAENSAEKSKKNPALEPGSIFHTWNQPRQLSDGSPPGTILGQGPTDLLQFYSNWPCAR